MVKKKLKKVNSKFLLTIFVLLTIGVITFVSTSLSIYTENRAIWKGMMFRHIGLGVVGGLTAMYVISRINYNIWKKAAPYIYIVGIILTALVFIPGIGISHGGASRWISLGFISFQPAELLKFSVIVLLSAWLAKHSDEINTFKKGFLAFILILAPALAILIKQPDTGSIALIGLVAFILYWIRGASWRHVFAVFGIGVIFIVTYVSINPYIIERIRTFSDASRDPYGASYQVRQSRIAIGSGKLTGRGLGQSVQKFGPYLPESNSDSIFAVFAEEYGFVGSTMLIFLYILLSFFGFKIAKRAPTIFAQNLVIGILLLINVQVFFNVAAISGIVPLSGLPLIFMSNGGTALFVTLAELGIVLNISRNQRNKLTKKRI